MLYVTLLWQHRKTLCDQEAMDREKVNGNHNIGHIRFLVDAYRPRYFYFEVIESFRRLILASVIGVVASEKSAASSILGFLFSSLFVYIFSKQEPFNFPEDNNLCVVLSYSLMFMFLGALLIKISVVQESSHDQQVFGIILIVIFLAGPASLMFQVAKGSITMIMQRFFVSQPSKLKTESSRLIGSNSLESSLGRNEQQNFNKPSGTVVETDKPVKGTQFLDKSKKSQKETKRIQPVRPAEIKTKNEDRASQDSKSKPKKSLAIAARAMNKSKSISQPRESALSNQDLL